MVRDGRVVLYDDKERVIAEAPCEEVWADRGKSPLVKVLQLWIGGDKYSLDHAPSVFSVLLQGVPTPSISNTNDLSEAFVEWFSRHGGNTGKPPS